MEAIAGSLFSRRQVIGAAGALAAVTMVPGLLRSVTPPHLSVRGGGSSEVDLTLGRFTPYVGSDFVVRTGGLAKERVTLVEAVAKPPHPHDRKGLHGESFSLIFAGAGAKAFDDGTFTVSHATMGAFRLFLVPVGQARETQRYQAVVNRRAPR